MHLKDKIYIESLLVTIKVAHRAFVRVVQAKSKRNSGTIDDSIQLTKIRLDILHSLRNLLFIGDLNKQYFKPTKFTYISRCKDRVLAKLVNKFLAFRNGKIKNRNIGAILMQQFRHSASQSRRAAGDESCQTL